MKNEKMKKTELWENNSVYGVMCFLQMTMFAWRIDKYYHL